MGSRPMRDKGIIDADAALFLMLFESQNFSKTAREIGQTQSSVSRRIVEFERKLGITLFDRTVRPIAPTLEGKALYRELCRYTEALDEAIGHLKLKNAINPEIRLGCVESLSLDLVPPVIERLMPVTSRVLQVTATSNLLLKHLLEHKLDIIISSDLFPGIQGLNRRLLFREPSLLVLPEAMAKGKKTPWTWNDLQFCGKPCIYYYHESGGGRLNETYLSSHLLTLPNKLEVDSNTIMVTLIRNNLGWTITRPSTILQTRSLADGVVAVPMPEPVLFRDLVLISDKSEDKRLVDACYKAVMDVLREIVIPGLVRKAPWLAESIHLYQAEDKN